MLRIFQIIQVHTSVKIQITRKVNKNFIVFLNKIRLIYVFIYYIVNKHLSFDYIRRAIIIFGIDHV